MNHNKVSISRRYRSRVYFTAVLCFSMVVGGWLFVACQSRAESELTGPKAQDRYVAQIVTALLDREHLSKHPLDDEISQRALKQYLEYFDPLKLYFYQSDIDEFMQKRDELDDMAKSGDISLAYTIFNRFLQRVDERLVMIKDLLQKTPDFAIDEELVTDRDKLQYPRNEAEARERWRKRIKLDFLVLKTDEEEPLEGDAAREKLTRRYESFVKRMHQTKSDDLLERFLTAISSSLDPHTTYMSPASLENFRIIMKLNLDGIGASLASEDGVTVIKKIIPGGAADKEGSLKEEDEVVSVGQDEDGEMVDVVDMRLDDVVQMIRGQAGTVVRLGIRSPGGATRIINITRAKIELKDSEARAEIIEEGQKPDGSPCKIGVIDLPSFYMDMEAATRGELNFKSTTRDVRKLLEEFKQKGVDVVVLDLRRNGGGSLNEAISLTGLFIDQGPVVQVKDSDGTVQHYDDTELGMVWDGPLVVLTSKFSASASEILAGAIQDYNRGLIIGDKATHGKGTVQSLLDLGPQMFRGIANPPNLGALKLTMQQFYRPDGDSTQKRGVLADIEIPSLTENMDVGEDDLDYALEFDRVRGCEFAKTNLVTPEILAFLRARSQQRMAGSKDFERLRRDIAEYVSQKNKKTITLNEEKFLAERAEMDADKEDIKQLEDQILNDSDQVVKRDYYFNEVLSVTVDYLNQLARRQAVSRAADTVPRP